MRRSGSLASALGASALCFGVVAACTAGGVGSLSIPSVGNVSVPSFGGGAASESASAQQVRPQQIQQRQPLSAPSGSIDPNAYPSAVDCRTVVLFNPNVRGAARGVPEWQRAFIGEWGGGAWDGRACHGLLIEEIRADGTVRLVELQGNYPQWNMYPTSFKRRAEFTPDGSLRVDRGRRGVAVYRMQGGVIYGEMLGPNENRRVSLYPK